VFKSKKGKESEQCEHPYVGFADIKQYLVEPNIEKDKRKLIVFNNLAEMNGQMRRGQEWKEYNHSVMLDIDIKETEPIKLNNYLKDTKSATKEEAHAKIIKQLKADPYCFYCDISHSGDIKALFTILSDKYIQLTSVNKDVDHDLARELHKENVHVFFQYLKDTYNLNYYNDRSIDYLDKAAFSYGQATHSTNGKEYHLKQDASILCYQINEKSIVEKVRKQQESKKTDDEVLQLNNNYSYAFFKFINAVIKENNTDRKVYVNKNLRTIFSNYTFPFLISISNTDVFFQKHYYTLYKKYYNGDSVDLTTFENFKAFIDSIPSKFILPIQSFLNKIYNTSLTRIKDDKNKDFFGNKYDITLRYKEFVGKELAQKEKIFKIFDTNNSVVIKAAAGGGKTTLIQDYIVKKFAEGMNRIVFCIPKNSLLTQLIKIINTNHPDISIVNNFKGQKYDITKYDVSEKILILSSTPNLRYCTDAKLVVIDEVQNLVAYSNTIISNRLNDVKQYIYISATPEQYLIYEESYYYMNLVKETNMKKDINVIVSNDINNTIKKLVDKDRQQMIFYNNLDNAKNLADSIKGIDFSFLNSKMKDDGNTYKTLVNERLYDNHCFVTSYVSDGINFKNKTWNDLIIVESDSLSVFELYQLTNRFRLVKNLNIYLIATSRSTDFGYELEFNHFKKSAFYNTELNFYNYRCDLINQNPIGNENNALVKSNHLIKGVDYNYVVNIDALKNDAYETHFKNIYTRCKDVFNSSVAYYFNPVMNFLKHDEQLKLTSNKQLENIFEQHTEAIVSLLKISSNFNNISVITEYENRFSDDELKLMNENLSFFKGLVKRYNQLLQLEGDLSKVTAKQNTYTNYVKNLKLKKLGENTDGKGIDNMSRKAWVRQNNLVDIIKAKNFTYTVEKKKEGIETAVDVKALVNYLTSDVTAMDSFKNDDNGYEFVHEEGDVSKYLYYISRSISKGIKYNTVEVDGKKKQTKKRYPILI
jgi:hypothetical protein